MRSPLSPQDAGSTAQSHQPGFQPRPFVDEPESFEQVARPENISSQSRLENEGHLQFNFGQVPIFPPTSAAIQPKLVADQSIQLKPNQAATAEPPANHYQTGWSDAASSGAKSTVTQAPQSSGWNASEFKVGTIRRIPIQGLKQGNQTEDQYPATGEQADGRAIVLIPTTLDLSQPVEVLLHFHGFTPGNRQQANGTVEDVELARIEQQLEASKRPLIAVLPQGAHQRQTQKSHFGNSFNSDAYLQDVLNALVQQKLVSQLPAIQRVVLSGHSAGGDVVSKMLSSQGAFDQPSNIGEVILFDGIHGGGEVPKTWVTDHLNRDLTYLISGISESEQLHYLETSMRFRGYYTNRAYAKRYEGLEQAIEKWFAKHAANLGGNNSPIYKRLRDNYQVLPVGHGDHLRVMGEMKSQDNDASSSTSPLLHALSGLPAMAASNSTSSPASSPVVLPPNVHQQGITSPSPSAEGMSPSSDPQHQAIPIAAPTLEHGLPKSDQREGVDHGIPAQAGPLELSTVIDSKALIRSSPPDLKSLGSIIPQGSQIEILETVSQAGREYALVQQVLPLGVYGPPMHWGWTLKSNLSAARKSDRTEQSDHFNQPEQPALNSQPTHASKDFKKITYKRPERGKNPKLDKLHESIDAILTAAGQNPAEWFSNFTTISFLGRPVKDPIHITLASHLKEIEAKFAAKYGSPEEAGKHFGLTEPIAGARMESRTAAYSMHIFGLAIDLDPAKNVYVASGKQTLESTNKIFNRVGMLLFKRPLKFNKYGQVGKAYAVSQEIDAALEKYFSYSEPSLVKKQELAALLQNSTDPEWQSKNVEEAQEIIKKDIKGCAALWKGEAKKRKTEKQQQEEDANQQRKEERVQKNGMMTLSEELVLGMGLDWGGRYGDFMHFDMRNRDIGEKVHTEIEKYKKK